VGIRYYKQEGAFNMAGKKDGQGMDSADGNENNWLKILSRLDTDIIPDGYETPETISKKMRRTLSVTRQRLKQAHDAGLVYRERVRINGNSTYVYKTKNPSQH